MTTETKKEDWEWPDEQVQRVKLLVPRTDSHQGKSQSEQRTCVFRFDADRNLLVVTVEGDRKENAIDMLDPRDIIGTSVEIKMIDPGCTISCARDHENHILPRIHEQDQFSKTRVESVVENEPMSTVKSFARATAVLSIYAYPKGKPDTKEQTLRFCGTERNQSKTTEARRYNFNTMNSQKLGCRYNNHRQFMLAPVEDFTDLSIMVNAIRKLSHSIPLFETVVTPHDEERILVIVNPYSGKRMGVRIYETILRPMLEQAGIAYDFLITSHAKHAEERMKKQFLTSDFRDITEYTGIVLVGGDGIIHEVVQGIHRRVDRNEILEKIKFGAIGAGTSNGFSASLAHASKENHSPLDSAFLIVKGVSSLVDLSRYETKSTSYASFLTFSWAMIADIDIESECIRWAGFLRMDIWGVVRLLFLRKYRARFSYLPRSGKIEQITLPPLCEPILDSKKWVTFEDNFILFWASQMTHAGEYLFHAPACKLNDGIFHIMIIRGNISRLRLAVILLSMEHGSHVGMNGVELIKCSAYRLEPITKGSFNNLDGEVIEAGCVQATVSPHPLRAYCNPKSV